MTQSVAVRPSAQTINYSRFKKDHPGPSASYWALLKQTVSDWSEDNCTRLAAALACYTVLSLAPLIVITFKIVGIVMRGEKAQQTVTHQLQSLVGPAASDQLIEGILKASHPGSGLVATVFSIAMLIFGASGVFGELQNSMNTIWEVKPKPNLGVWGFLRARFLSMAMVLGVAFLLMVSLFVSTIISSLTTRVIGDARIIGILVDIVVSILVMTVLFAATYKFLPDVKLAWKYVWLGALITAVLFGVGKWGLTLYFRFGTPASAYGAAGSLAAAIIWIYYSAWILFFGAEFTKVYARAHGQPMPPTDYAVRLTETERVQQGIPHEQTVDAAVAAKEGKCVPPLRIRRSDHSKAGVLGAAGAGMALGALAVLGFANTTKNRMRREAAAIGLQVRLNELERRAAKASRLRDGLKQVGIDERIAEVDERIRHAAKNARRVEKQNAGTWLERLLHAVKQYL